MNREKIPPALVNSYSNKIFDLVVNIRSNSEAWDELVRFLGLTSQSEMSTEQTQAVRDFVQLLSLTQYRVSDMMLRLEKAGVIRLQKISQTIEDGQGKVN
jgi:hypothetical protein